MTDTATTTTTRDVYQKITDHIITAIEAGAGDFQMPWHRGGTAWTRPANARTGRPYKGVNVVALWAAAEISGYSCGFWGTYKQWRELDAQVRKGQKASVIVFYKEVEYEVPDEDTGELLTETYLVARASWVFNADQVDGWQAPVPTVRSQAEVLDRAETFVGHTAAEIRHGGDQGYYRYSTDHIQMPDRDRFTGTATSTATESYYATLLHELTHWTAHKSRLDRDLSGRFGDQAYAMEELVAELGAAFLCADVGVANSPRPDHAAYIANWLEVLKRDKKAIFTAASRASQAADYLAGLQHKTQEAARNGPDGRGLRNRKEARQ